MSGALDATEKPPPINRKATIGRNPGCRRSVPRSTKIPAPKMISPERAIHAAIGSTTSILSLSILLSVPQSPPHEKLTDSPTLLKTLSNMPTTPLLVSCELMSPHSRSLREQGYRIRVKSSKKNSFFHAASFILRAIERLSGWARKVSRAMRRKMARFCGA